MVRKLALMLGVGLLLGLVATPAQAVPGVVYRDHSVTAQAFWYTHEQLTAHTFRESVWYVGVYMPKGQKAFSDLYQSVDMCRSFPNGNIRCTQESFKVGYTDLSGDNESFKVDLDALEFGHLEGTYKLRTYDENGNPVGDAERYQIVTDWSENGDAHHTRERYYFSDGCFRVQSLSRGRSRPALAEGTLNGSSLGLTDESFIAINASIYREHTCEDSPPPPGS